jgi:hypothetical protein
MDDSSDDRTDGDATDSTAGDAGPEESGDPDVEALRRQVEGKYDFDDFGPQDMAEMTAREWEVAFDHESWITGPQLLDRLEADLKTRVVQRDVFARVERFDDPDRLVAYSDEGYAVVYEDGTVEGVGTVLRDVKPSIALASMEEYDAPEMPEGEVLPSPLEVPEGSGELGNRMLQVVAAAQLLFGIGLLVGALGLGLNLIAGVAGLFFLAIGAVLFFVVANARLSDKFRAEEYRNRLRAVGLDADERPAFLDELEERHRPPDDAPEADEETSRDTA